MKPALHIITRATGIALLSAAALVTNAITPAAAGGSLSMSVNANNAEGQQALHSAIQLFSIISDLDGGSGVNQTGVRNNAGLNQWGSGNLGIVHQDGSGHQGSLQQIGNNNSYGLFQFGKNTNSHIRQRGHGQSGATFVFGW